MNYFDRVKEYLFDLDIIPVIEDYDNGFFVITESERHVENMYLSIRRTDLMLDQFIFDVPSDDVAYQAHLFKRLLQMSGNLTHGAFVLDEGADKILYHDTLALDNLDLNELESSINAITLGFEEFGRELLMLHEEV